MSHYLSKIKSGAQCHNLHSLYTAWLYLCIHNLGTIGLIHSELSNDFRDLIWRSVAHLIVTLKLSVQN